MEIHTLASPTAWAAFIGFVLLMLALDLGVFHRHAHVIKFKEAAIWSAVWVSLSLLFNVGIWWKVGPVPATEFLSGYLIEKSLSVDNIFVFVVIFQSLRIPSIYQHRVLFWGILSALVLRAVMILAGTALLARFHWLIYVFGGFLIITGLKLLYSWKKGDEEDPTQGTLVRLLRKVIPTSSRLDGPHFLTMENGRKVATPLLVALMLVEVSDVVFALDSIPAIFAVTRDPFIVFTSNIFAILGLRSLFFLLAGMMEKFHYLKVGLAGILVFVGVKMAMVDVFKLSPFVSVGIIATMLALSVIASFVYAGQHPAPSDESKTPAKS